MINVIWSFAFLVCISLVSSASHGKPNFHYEQGKIVMRDENLKFIQGSNRKDRVEFSDESGKAVSIMIEPDKLCKKGDGVEPWSYHRNQDGTYGLVGIKVVIPKPNRKNVTIRNSSVCGRVAITGHTVIEDSQIYGGQTDEEVLNIGGPLSKDINPILIRDVEAVNGAWGKIAGYTEIYRGTFEGDVEIDSCSSLSEAESCNLLDKLSLWESNVFNGTKILGPVDAIYSDFTGESEYVCRSGVNCNFRGTPENRITLENNTISGKFQFLYTDVSNIIADAGLSGFIDVQNSVLGENVELNGTVQILSSIIGNDVVIRGASTFAPDCNICKGISISMGSYLVGSNIYLNGWIYISDSDFGDNVYFNASKTSNVGLSYLKNTHISGRFFSYDWNLEGQTFIGSWGCDELGGGCREIPLGSKEMDFKFLRGFLNKNTN